MSGGANLDIRIVWGDLVGGQVGETEYTANSGSNPSFISGTKITLEGPGRGADWIQCSGPGSV